MYAIDSFVAYRLLIHLYTSNIADSVVIIAVAYCCCCLAYRERIGGSRPGGKGPRGGT